MLSSLDEIINNTTKRVESLTNEEIKVVEKYLKEKDGVAELMRLYVKFHEEAEKDGYYKHYDSTSQL